MKPLLIVGAIIGIATVIAYVYPLFGKPIHIFWVPVGILGLVLVGFGMVPNKKDK